MRYVGTDKPEDCVCYPGRCEDDSGCICFFIYDDPGPDGEPAKTGDCWCWCKMDEPWPPWADEVQLADDAVISLSVRALPLRELAEVLQPISPVRLDVPTDRSDEPVSIRLEKVPLSHALTQTGLLPAKGDP